MQQTIEDHLLLVQEDFLWMSTCWLSQVATEVVSQMLMLELTLGSLHQADLVYVAMVGFVAMPLKEKQNNVTNM